MSNQQTVKKATKFSGQIYNEQISFGRKSLVEFLITKTKAFNEFQDMSAFVTSILKASNYPFFVVDTNLNVEYMNPACLEFTGLNLNSVAGKMVCKDIFKSDLCQSHCPIEQAMKTKSPIIGRRVKVRDGNKKEHTIIVNAGAFVDKNGDVLGGFEIWRDAMPDADVASRINLLSNKVNDCCSEMNRLIDGLRKNLTADLPEDAEGHKTLLDMKQCTDSLLNSCNSLFNSHCWDLMNCPPERQVQCPAFPNYGGKCWNVDYTWCDGQMQGKATEKTDRCKSCVVYRNCKVDEAVTVAQ